MKVLVVGGAGFIGSHVCKALAMAGFTPITYDNLSTGHSWAIQYGPFVQGDMEDEWTLQEAFETHEPKAVIHLASLINVRDSIRNPGLYYEKNLLGTLTLLKTMVKCGVDQCVFSSTAAIYGSPQYVPIDEIHPKSPLNAYGKTKWAIEGMLEDFSHAHQLRFVALRYFNAAGADPSGIMGEAHYPETHLIPLAIQAALKETQELQIYGDDYPTPDGTAIRDYIHVTDLAEAHVRALHYLQREGTNLQANLGTGTGYSVKEIIHAIEEATQATVPLKICPRLAHDSPILVANPHVAKNMLGWEPEFSDLPTIIATAVHWHKKYNRREQLAFSPQR